MHSQCCYWICEILYLDSNKPYVSHQSFVFCFLLCHNGFVPYETVSNSLKKKCFLRPDNNVDLQQNWYLSLVMVQWRLLQNLWEIHIIRVCSVFVMMLLCWEHFCTAEEYFPCKRWHGCAVLIRLNHWREKRNTMIILCHRNAILHFIFVA